MISDHNERRSDSRTEADQYYSVEHSVPDAIYINLEYGIYHQGDMCCGQRGFCSAETSEGR